MGINCVLPGTGTRRITERSQRFADGFPPRASPGPDGLVLTGLLEMHRPHTPNWDEGEILGLIAKGFLAPGLITAADVSPQCVVLLQKVPRLLHGAAALAELLKPRWCQMSLKRCSRDKGLQKHSSLAVLTVLFLSSYSEPHSL